MMSDLTHFDDQGASRMVNVGEKPVTLRTAKAEGRVRMSPETLKLIQNREFAKGDVFEVARIAGIMATKKTPELIPLCHGLSLDSAEVNFEVIDESTVRIEASVQVHAKTGVEMEAMTSVSVAALTIYDMCKSKDRSMTINGICLVEKSGGKSGFYHKDAK